MSWQARAFSRVIRAIVRRRRWGTSADLAARARRVFGAPKPYAWLTTLGLSRERYRHGHVRGEWLIPRDALPGVVLYVHGGGFVSCSAATHRPIAAALARFTRRRVYSAEYRLAPEAPLPAAQLDVMAAYDYVMKSSPASEVALVGDSAGGNLVLRLAVGVRDSGRDAPACVVAFSPWTDLAGRSPSVLTNEGRCAMFYPENIREFAAAACGDIAPDAPSVSPVYADLRGLPPVLLQVGSTELLLDDARRVQTRIQECNGRCALSVYDDVPHGWQMLAPFVPEATASLREAAAFISTAFGVQI